MCVRALLDHLTPVQATHPQKGIRCVFHDDESACRAAYQMGMQVQSSRAGGMLGACCKGDCLLTTPRLESGSEPVQHVWLRRSGTNQIAALHLCHSVPECLACRSDTPACHSTGMWTPPLFLATCRFTLRWLWTVYHASVHCWRTAHVSTAPTCTRESCPAALAADVVVQVYCCCCCCCFVLG